MDRERRRRPQIMALVWATMLASIGAVTNRESQERQQRISALKAKIHSMSYIEAEKALRALASTAPRERVRQSLVDHFVVLYQENHAFDHMLGCLQSQMPGVDGIPSGGRAVWINASNHSQGFVNVSCGNASYVCESGPTYSLFAGKFGNGSGSQCRYYPYDDQSDNNSFVNLGQNVDTTVNMYSPEQLPVKTALAENFGIFNRLFTSVPTFSMPNHMFTQSGTSCGSKDNVWPWTQCGGSRLLYPQWTIYDQLAVDGVDFGIYFDLLDGVDDTLPPDVYMSGVLRALPNWRLMDQFERDAATGTLPAFVWVIPKVTASDHPCSDNRLGEAVQKKVYETLRASPHWNRTLLLIAYDDGGGYYDHVVPPFENIPADNAPCSANITQCLDPFDFKRLGLRSTALLASPLIPKGAVFQEPPGNASHFDLASVIATARELFNLSSTLTDRDAWSAPFLSLLTEATPRTDTPPTLPDPPTNDIDEDTERTPQHCAASDGVCKGQDAMSNKQRRNIQLFSVLTGRHPPPDIDSLSRADANIWLNRHIRLLMERGVNPNTDHSLNL